MVAENLETQMPEDKPGFYVPTRQQVRDKRDQEREGFWFPLARTGGYAHIRMLSVLDKATLTGLSSDMQNRVLRAFSEATAGTARATTVDQFIKNRDVIERLANVVSVASFIMPKLVMTEAELDDDPRTLLVTDLHIDERMAVYNIVMGTEQGRAEEAKLLPFHGGTASRSVDALPADEARDTPERLSGDAGVRVLDPYAANLGPDGAGIRRSV